MPNIFHNLFHYNSETGRFAIGDQDLHCGDCFQLLAFDKWHDVRIELAHGSLGESWYLVGMPKGASNDCWDFAGETARRYE